MKKPIISFALALFMAAGCDSTSEKSSEKTDTVEALPDTRKDEDQPNDLLIASGRAGRISIGMSDQEAQSQYSEHRIKKTQLQKEGMNYNAYLVHSLNNHEDILFEVELLCVNGCQVKRLFIQNKNMKTAEGIGVGSTFGELQQVYPITYIGAGEGNVVAASEEKNMSFMLDKADLDTDKIPELKIEDIPDSAQVVGILVL